MPMRSAWSLLAASGLLLAVACTGDDPQLPGALADAGGAVGGGVVPDDAADDDDHDLVVDGVLSVCISAPFPPFSHLDADTDIGFGGFDIDLAAELAERLGLALAVEDVAFEAITSGEVLREERCDLAAAALTVSDEWSRHLDFTAPYFEVKQSLLTLAGEPISGLAAADGKRIGVQTGMPAERFAGRELPAGAEIVRFDNTADLLAALDIGDIDAVVQDLPTSTAWVEAGNGVHVVETFVTDDVYAMAVVADRADALLSHLDAHLADIRADGTRERLLAEHFALPADGRTPG